MPLMGGALAALSLGTEARWTMLAVVRCESGWNRGTLGISRSVDVL